jgi:D-amino-acid dehydrogenase
VKTFDVAVIGGGIVGTACALELLERGRSVVVVERDEAGSGTAGGSAGYLADGEIFPVAQLRTIAALPRMLFDPLGPLVIRPAYAPRMIDWGLRFLGATRRGRFRSGTRALASLNRLANDALFDLATRSGAERYLVRDGALHVTQERSTLEHLISLVAALAENGIAARFVERDALLKMEPRLSAQVLGGIYYPGAGRCTDPTKFGAALAANALAKGGTIVRTDARSLEQSPDLSWRVQTGGGPLEATRALVTAGVWSRDLVRPLGYRVPLEAARGYHLMLPNAGVTLQRTVLIEEAHFCATPMENGVRLAGTVEFAGVDALPNYARSDMLFGIASRHLPGLRADGATRWMGSRPSFPDSLPAIGASRRHRNLYFCFGHEKLGLTQSAISARCIADLIAGETPAIDLSPFSLDRFA